MTNKQTEEVIKEFRKELREAYKGILPDELIQKNEWFENFLLTAIKEAEERGRKDAENITKRISKDAENILSK